MTIESNGPQPLVTWGTSPNDPCLLRWRVNRARAHWHEYPPAYNTPAEAEQAAHAFARINFIPAHIPQKARP